MFPATLYALVVVTLCNLYWWRFFLVCSAAYTGYSDCNLDCMVVHGGGGGSGGGCCPCSSGTYSYYRGIL